ncbi:DUF2529 domain-containing protein [Bacillus methanolicus]|uniref:DUF2529 domain-containing protein n=1 Tax=Bacillus methanolicus (strain MGA3 / ATCC 53907) TaxID=796606 RepID=I3EBM8_BACMM|nr:DUF2529 domain-containing protein [Bacillus methanolicus]AIE61580.1 hypothetical protein BMMGA3_16135 [Bacillus methanolicus MGA3]EIJ83899.1 hypothetical protein MGA3_01365 [Bacillus methanolicus MGA3]
MLKMFSTQLTGLFNRIQDKEEFSIEDGARLLAQAAVGDGSIYICGLKEMAAVEAEATEGAEPLVSAKKWTALDEIQEADRVLLLSRYSRDKEAVEIARALTEKNIPFVAVSTAVENNSDDLTSLADIHIDLRLVKGLLPNEEGGRFGYPSSIAALFVYFALKLTIDEIIAEYE